MKLALVTGSAPLGGVIVSTSILYKQFEKAGHQVALVLTSDELGDGVDLLKEVGIPFEAPGKRESSVRKRCALLLNVLKGFDVVIHAESTESSYCSPALPEKTISIKIVRNTFEIAHGKPFFNQKSLNGFVCISPVVREMMMLYKPQVPISVIPNATLFNECGRRQDRSGPVNVVYLGRLNEFHKGIFILPKILAEAKRQGVDFSLTIAGSGRDEDELWKRLSDQEDNIKIQRLSRTETEDLLQKSDLLLVPSKFEAFGLTVIEGMATGCIPICSSAPVFSWILGKHSELLQVSSDTATEYVEIIKRLSADHDLLTRIRSDLLVRQKSLFSAEALGKGYLRQLEVFSNSGLRPVRTGRVVIPIGRKMQDFWWGKILHKIYMKIR
jgi:glycosyltransferase involved in cell wall biosynthesis